MAVEHIKSGKDGVFISFNGIFPALEAVSPNDKDELLHAGKSGDRISSPRLLNKNILVITPYPSINYSSYCLDGVDEVLHTMYHSATAPKQVLDFIKRCESRGVKFSFVTTKSSADYETALQFKNIIFNSTLENAYARALYTTLTDSGDDHEE
jgi:hypothetical protein